MIYTTLLNIAIFQGIVLGFIILKSSIFNSNSNKYLAGLLFTLSIILLNYVFELEEVFISYPLLRFIDNIDWIFLLPVFTFLFIINRIDDSVKNRQKIYTKKENTKKKNKQPSLLVKEYGLPKGHIEKNETLLTPLFFI